MSTGRGLDRLDEVKRLLGRMRAIAQKQVAERSSSAQALTIDAMLEESDRAIVERVAPYTMTSVERIVAVIDTVEYVTRRGIPGAFAECGVWRGGSVLTMILALQRLGTTDRDIFLFDTFEGMTAPTEHDTSTQEESATATWHRAVGEGRRAWDWAFGSEVYGLDQVRDLLQSTGYPIDRLHFVVGPVEDTVPDQAPAELAVLRLDTDWYESTRHELVHLYPRLNLGGVLIIDDYGHWEGARRAVDEYFSSAAAPLMLSRLDYTGRIATKW